MLHRGRASKGDPISAALGSPSRHTVPCYHPDAGSSSCRHYSMIQRTAHTTCTWPYCPLGIKGWHGVCLRLGSPKAVGALCRHLLSPSPCPRASERDPHHVCTHGTEALSESSSVLMASGPWRGLGQSLHVGAHTPWGMAPSAGQGTRCTTAHCACKAPSWTVAPLTTHAH